MTYRCHKCRDFSFPSAISKVINACAVNFLMHIKTKCSTEVKHIILNAKYTVCMQFTNITPIIIKISILSSYVLCKALFPFKIMGQISNILSNIR